MEVQTSVFKRSGRTKTVKRPNGSLDSYELKSGWFYRIKYTEPSGRPRVAEYGPFDLKNKAKDAMNRKIKELEASQGRSRDFERWTFADLAKHCLGPGGMYAEGALASRSSVVAHIESLKRYFGNFKLSAISRESIRGYHHQRLKETRPTASGVPRLISVATANREVATLRAMLFHAIGEGWITYNPFFKLKLISTKNEVTRTRILSFDEERRLLAACEGSWTVPYERTWKGRKQQLTATFTLDNRHLRAMIILAIDSGMRRGEILKLQWRDIDFEKHKILIRSENSKTGLSRETPVSKRAQAELEALRPYSSDDRPFPYVDIKRSFETAKRLAGIDDLRFHDLRRTNISRLQSQGAAMGMVGKAVGHSQSQTTFKHYTVADDDALDQMRSLTDAMNERNAEGQQGTELVN